MTTTPRHGLLKWSAGFTQSDIILNDLLDNLDVKLGLSVVSRTTDAQPGAPSEGDCYIITGAATGTDWAGFSQYDVAIYRSAAWTAFTPITGWLAWVEDDANAVMWDGAAWTQVLVANAIGDADFAGAEGFMRKTGAGTYEVIKSNLAASVAPTANEDSGDGYAVGSVWIDTTADLSYVCVDASVGAAVWLTASGLSEAQVDARVVAVASGRKSIWIPVAQMFAAALQPPDALANVGDSSGGASVVQVRPFDPSSVEILFFTWAVPNGMDLSIGLSFTVYWAPTTTNTGTVRWRVNGVSLADGDAVNSALGGAAVVVDAANGTIDDLHVSGEISQGVLAGIAAGELLSLRIDRHASDAADTYTGDANLIGLMMHYTTDAPTDD